MPDSVAAVDEALHPHPVVRGAAEARVGGRVDDPERRRRRVLGRVGRVRVELVALPHERVDERLERRSSAAAPRSWRRSWAARRRPCAPRAGRASRTPAAPSRRPGSAPPSARARSATGSRYAAEQLHGHHRHLHRVVEDRAAEVERQRDLAVRQRVDVLGRRHLEVVGARRRRARTPPCRGTPARPCRPAPTGSCASSTPSARARRRAPRAARAWRRRSGAWPGRSAAGRRARSRARRRPSVSFDAQGEAQRRCRRVRDGLGAEHLEPRGERHAPTAGRARCASRYSETAAGDAGAARDPLPRGLHDADQPVGRVDRHDHLLRLVAEAVDDQRLGVGLELELRVGLAQRSPTRPGRARTPSRRRGSGRARSRCP